MTTVYIPDLFREVVAATSAALGTTVYFDYGHYSDVTKNLTLKDGAIQEGTRQKYPLIWLVMDFEERMGTTLGQYAELPNAQLIFACNTQMNYTMDERRDNSFLPVLYPLYKEFFRQLGRSRKFSIADLDTLPYSKWDRPFWAGDEGGGKNMFNDFIDAIQIKNLRLSVMQAACVPSLLLN